MELKENIDDLDKIDIELSNDLETLNTDYELKSFLRKNLILIEFNRIRLLVREYNTNNTRIELELFTKAKSLLPVIDERRLLLEEKRKFYSGLIPYIDGDFKEEYLKYIERDAKIFNEQRDIETDLIIKKEILNNKVEIIETKIQEHRDFINESIRKVIETRLDEKIQNLNNNEAFQILSHESKIKVLDKTIEKVEIKLQNLEDSIIITGSGILLETTPNALDKKIQTYKIALEKLEKFRDSLK
ncbi:MAG: hypothetical protein QM490_04745 [Candidatus Gracilibacteria bacterium]